VWHQLQAFEIVEWHASEIGEVAADLSDVFRPACLKSRTATKRTKPGRFEAACQSATFRRSENCSKSWTITTSLDDLERFTF
jgi:hypothetical protein